MRRALVIIARDRPEVWLTWAAFYGGAESVRLILDRRHAPPEARRVGSADRRAQRSRNSDLQERGFLVIPQAEQG